MGRALKRESRHAIALASPFTKVAKAIAKNHGVRVVPSSQACCTDGSVIYVPFAAEIAEGATLQTLNGMLDHELGHVRVEEDCKRRGIPGFVQRLRDASKRGDSELSALMNVVEDVRIEIDLGAEFPGMKDNLQKLNERMAGIRVDNARKGKHESLWREITVGFIARARGFDQSWMTPKAQAYLDGCEDLVERSRNLKTMLEGIALANELKDRLHEIADERREAEKERRKAERKAEREKAEGESEAGDEPGDEMSDDEGEPDPSHVDHAGELGDKPEGSEDGEPAPADGDDDGDDDEAGGPGDPSAGEGDSEDGPSESDDREGGSDSEGSEDDDDREGDDGDKTPGAAGDKGDKSEGSDDPEPAETGGEASEGDDGDAEDEDEDEEIPSELGEGPEFEDHRDELRDALEDDLVKSARERGIKLPHPLIVEMDTWRTAHSGDCAHDPYGYVKAEVRSQIGALRQKQIARIQTRARARLHVGLDDGDLDQSRLHEVAVGARDVYSEIRPGRQVNVAIQVLLDLSGSIAGGCEHFMRRTLVALAESWEPIRGMSYDILGFHNFYPSQRSLPKGVRLMGLQADGVHYVRMPFEMIHFKQYHERIAAFRSRFKEVSAHSDNCDHEAVWMAAKRLAARPEERKILCVINDGAPASHGVPYEVLRGGLPDVVRTITGAGIEVWGVGAGTDSPRHYYNASTGARNVCINNLQTMAPTLLGLFAKRIEAA